MTLTEFLRTELDREIDRSRRALEQVPDGRSDWKPHERSMAFGYLVNMVATIPSWITLQLTKDEFDIAPADGSTMRQDPKTTSTSLVQALEASAAEAREALGKATDAHLAGNWNLKARGAVVQSGTRAAMIQDTITHWAHHRGQMTVYLRLMGAKVPALYGPSADEQRF